MLIELDIPDNLPLPDRLNFSIPESIGANNAIFKSIRNGAADNYKESISIDSLGKTIQYIPNKSSGVWSGGENAADVFFTTLNDYKTNTDQPVTFFIKRSKSSLSSVNPALKGKVIQFDFNFSQDQSDADRPHLTSDITSQINKAIVDDKDVYTVAVDYEVLKEGVKDVNTLHFNIEDEEGSSIIETEIEINYGNQASGAPIVINLNGSRPSKLFIDLKAHYNHLPIELCNIDSYDSMFGGSNDFKTYLDKTYPVTEQTPDFNHHFNNDFSIFQRDKEPVLDDRVLTLFKDLLEESVDEEDDPSIGNDFNHDFEIGMFEEYLFWQNGLTKTPLLNTTVMHGFSSAFNNDFDKPILPAYLVLQPNYSGEGWQDSKRWLLRYCVKYGGISYHDFVIVNL